MFLFINTSSADKIALALIDDQGKILKHKNIPAEYKQSEKLLLNIDKMLKARTGDAPLEKTRPGRNWKLETGNYLNRLKGIISVKGPGSFTALRIGVTTANVLAFGWGIPVAGVKSEEFKQMVSDGIKKLNQAKLGQWVMPEYGMEPNIQPAR